MAGDERMYRSGKLEKILILGGIVFSIIMIMVIVFLVRGGMNDDKDTVNYGMYARMISLAQVSSSTIENTEMDNHYDGDDSWYVKYMNYMYYKKDFEAGKHKKAGDYLTYGDLKVLFDNRNIKTDDVEEMTGLAIRSKKSREKISFENFVLIYDAIIPYFDIERIGNYEEVTICGNYDSHNIVTGEDGIYEADGISGDEYRDKRVNAFIKDGELIYVKAVVSDEITYNNVYVTEYSDNELRVYIEGINREYKVDTDSQIDKGSIADLYITDGTVTQIHLKSDKIDGKILSVTDEYIEVEKYGKVPLEENFNVYRSYGELKMMKKSDILVGYDLQEFVVANGKICAAVIDRSLTASNIRVLIMSSGYTSIFHNNVSLTCTGGFSVNYGDITEHYDANTPVTVDNESRYLTEGRVKIVPDEESSRIQINSVARSQGIPAYRGDVEIARTESGLVIINELPLEQYLYSVVPSEMPVRYGEEAQKVQAVCARSYAYIQILNNSYSMYGAHVDDSVAYQVYNNINEQDISVKAVNETYGEVLKYAGDVIEAFYYSTSCGYASDSGIWNDNPDSYPYLTGHTINEMNEKKDLTDEVSFRTFIDNPDATAYDSDFAFFRWDAVAGIGDISGIVNSNINARYKAAKNSVRTLKDGEFVSIPISTVGTITNIEVTKRKTGGIADEVKITGTDNTVLVSGEYNIRALFGDESLVINKKDKTTYSASLLPSAFIYFDPILNDGNLSGYMIKGGGYGHGVGMSQNAVSKMVETMNYRQILEFFYKETNIETVY